MRERKVVRGNETLWPETIERLEDRRRDAALAAHRFCVRQPREQHRIGRRRRGGRLQLCDAFGRASHLDQRRAENTPRGREIRLHVHHASARLDRCLVIARHVLRPGGARADDEAQRIQLARALRFADRFGRSAETGQQEPVPAMRAIAARIERDRLPESCFCRVPLPVEHRANICDREMGV